MKIKNGYKKPHIHILALGGTIACALNKQNESFYTAPSIGIHELISMLPFNKNEVAISSEQFNQQISHEMTDKDLILLAKHVQELMLKETIDGLVITHGTNCIEETAYFFNLVIHTKKPIVFTGSFRPSNALGFDGLRNLYNSIILASSKKIHGIGVVLTFNDNIINARDAIKINPSVMHDLSINGFGSLGILKDNQPLIYHNVSYRHTFSSEFNIKEITYFPKIYIIYGHMNIDGAFAEAAISNQAQGIISAGMGHGYQPTKLNEALIQASQKGIFVIRCSRTGQGIVSKESKLDDRHGFVAGGSLNPQKARILLATALTKTEDKKEIQRIFNEY